MIFIRSPFTKYILTGILSVYIIVFYYTFTSSDQVVGFLSDDAVYLMQAELYSPWHTEKSAVVDFIREESRFPPLYPMLLGFAGVDTNTSVLAANITVSLLLATIFIAGVWALKVSDQLAFTLVFVLTISFLPASLILSQGLWSEFLFMCLLYGALICIDKEPNTNQHWLAAALLLALASLTRSIGITIISAYILLLFIKRPKNFLYFIAVSTGPFLIWSLSKSLVLQHSNYVNDMSDYLGKGSYQQLLESIITQIISLGNSWVWLFSIIKPGNLFHYTSLFIAGLFFFLAILGFLPRLKRLKLDALCLPFYLCAVLLWPYTDVYYVSRFLYPLLPLFLVYMWLGLSTFNLLKKYKKLYPVIFFSLIVIISYPSTKQFISRAYTELDSELMPYRRSRAWLLAPNQEAGVEIIKKDKQLLETLPQISKHISDSHCIYALQTPLVMLHTKRISAAFSADSGSNSDFTIHNNRCAYYLAMPVTGLGETYPPYYPMQYIVDNKNFETIPFYPKTGEPEDPIIYLIKRVSF